MNASTIDPFDDIRTMTFRDATPTGDHRRRHVPREEPRRSGFGPIVMLAATVGLAGTGYGAGTLVHWVIGLTVAGSGGALAASQMAPPKTYDFTL